MDSRVGVIYWIGGWVGKFSVNSLFVLVIFNKLECDLKDSVFFFCFKIENNM